MRPPVKAAAVFCPAARPVPAVCHSTFLWEPEQREGTVYCNPHGKGAYTENENG